MKKSEKPVIVEETFSKSVEEVWDAITNPEKMREWYFDNIPDFQPTVGFKTEFNIKSEERDFLHKWNITNVIPNKIIRYNWRYEDYPGNSYVTFELNEKNGITKLILTLQVTEDFPEDIPEFKRESCLAGWKYFIQQRLSDYLS